MFLTFKIDRRDVSYDELCEIQEFMMNAFHGHVDIRREGNHAAFYAEEAFWKGGNRPYDFTIRGRRYQMFPPAQMMLPGLLGVRSEEELIRRAEAEFRDDLSDAYIQGKLNTLGLAYGAERNEYKKIVLPRANKKKLLLL